jgi:septal ring-binding cell division protein DamX
MRDLEEAVAGTNASVRKVGTILAVVVMAAVVVFSLGVMVGKRVTGNVSIPSDPPSALPTENLRPRPPAEKASQGATKPLKKTSREPVASEKLTFFDTLSGDKAAAPPSLPKETPVVKKAPLPVKKPVAPKAEPAKKSPPPPKKAAPPPSKAAGDPGARVMSLTGKGDFAVQVASTTNSSWANELVRRLKKNGVTASASAVTLKGKLWYRIRVASFSSRESANKALKILKEMGHDGMVVGLD